MFYSFYKLILIFTINLIISVPIYATTVEQKQLKFPVKIQELMKGETHYFSEILSPRKLVVKHPEFFELDALSLIQESNVTMMMAKTVSIVSRPAGFFEQQQMTEDKFMSHIMGEQKVSRLGPNLFKISVPGEKSLSYKMQSYFDADDVSTLPSSKITRAINAVKKLDVISQGASAIMYTEKTNFTNFAEGAITVSSFHSLKENKTLIISYHLVAVKKPFNTVSIRKAMLNETLAVNKLIESFK